MIKKRSLRTLATGLMLLGTSVISASAATLYVTSFNAGQILSLNTVTKATSVVVTAPGGSQVDCLVFDGTGRIIYTVYNLGQVRVYNPSNSTDTVLASGFSSQTVDLALEPGGATVLLADRGNNSLRRINITTGVVTTLGSAGAFSGPNGIAYDGGGNLYVALGNSTIVQVNPTTGAVIKTGGNSIDGMTYDSSSNKLWGASGNCIYNYDLATLTASACISGFSGADGLVGDGAGNIYVASNGTGLVQMYNITGATTTTVSNAISGLDDLAPASGLGAPVNPPPNTPVPSSLTLILVGMGLVALFGVVRKVRASAVV